MAGAAAPRSNTDRGLCLAADAWQTELEALAAASLRPLLQRTQWRTVAGAVLIAPLPGLDFCWAGRCQRPDAAGDGPPSGTCPWMPIQLRDAAMELAKASLALWRRRSGSSQGFDGPDAELEAFHLVG